VTLQEFAAAVLISRGALADTDSSGLHVVAPPELAVRLGLREYQHLVFEPELDTTDRLETLRLDYDSPLVEALGGLLDPGSRLAFVDAPVPSLKPIDPQRELERGITLRNGVLRLRECTPVTTIYLCFVFEYEALADERRGGLMEFWINPDVHSVAEWPGLLDRATPGDYLLASDLVVVDQLKTASMLAGRVAGVMAHQRLNDLLESLDRRRAGDLRRLREYFDGIYQEIGRKVQRATRSEARVSEIGRLDATREAYLTRVADVVERYRVHVRVRPLLVVGYVMSAYRLRVELLRRRTTSEVMFSWNALDRGIEARCCDGCARPIHVADLCDAHAHWLCSDCVAACPECGRPYCRACHEHCPRPHQ